MNVEAEEAQGKSLEATIRDSALQRVIDKALTSDDPVEGEMTLETEQGDLVLQVHGTCLRDSRGGSIGAVVVLNDVSQLKALENIRREFVANVSHELRTPVTAIKGFIERGYTENVTMIGLHPLTNYLRFKDWQGLDGKGQYDVVIFMGIFYKFASAMFSALKNFNRDIKRVSIDRYYHVNADMTFGNLAFNPDQYHEAVDEVIATLTK